MKNSLLAGGEPGGAAGGKGAPTPRALPAAAAADAAASARPHPLSRRRFLAGLAVAAASAAAFPLSGCVDQHPYRNADGTEQQRLVATSPAVADICDKLELDLVGICTTTRDVPERYADLPQVGSPMSPDLEVLKSLHPSCVLSPNSLISDLQPKYAGIAVACMFLDLRSVDGMFASIDALGRRFDRRTQAQALIDEHNAFMDEYRASIEGMPQPTVLVLMGLPGSYIVATENSYAGSLVALAGGQNVYAGTDEEFINVNTEDMQARDPDIILRTSHALPDQVMAMFADEFATNDVWKHFRAVQEGRVYDLPYDEFGMSATFNYPDALATVQPMLYGEAAGGDGEAVGDAAAAALGDGSSDDDGSDSADGGSAASQEG